jgi:hypothetical protein
LENRQCYFCNIEVNAFACDRCKVKLPVYKDDEEMTHDEEKTVMDAWNYIRNLKDKNGN